MSTVRKFQFGPAEGIGRKLLHLSEPVFNEPLYAVDNIGPADTAMVKDVKDGKSRGSVTATMSTHQASFTATGSKDVPSSIIRMSNKARQVPIDHFSFEVNTPGFLMQRVEWKHTKDVPSWLDKQDAVHMKLVYEGTNNIIARFLHKPTAPDALEGTFEMHEDHGLSWDLTVFLSCLAVLKYVTLTPTQK